MMLDFTNVEVLEEGEYPEVPKGSYECSVVKIEAKYDDKTRPVIDFAFKIIKGEYKGSWIWKRSYLNSPKASGFTLGFIRSLDDGKPDFKFGRYETIEDMNPELNDLLSRLQDNYEYAVAYNPGDGKNVYRDLKILEVYPFDEE